MRDKYSHSTLAIAQLLAAMMPPPATLTALLLLGAARLGEANTDRPTVKPHFVVILADDLGGKNVDYLCVERV